MELLYHAGGGSLRSNPAIGRVSLCNVRVPGSSMARLILAQAIINRKKGMDRHALTS